MRKRKVNLKILCLCRKISLKLLRANVPHVLKIQISYNINKCNKKLRNHFLFETCHFRKVSLQHLRTRARIQLPLEFHLYFICILFKRNNRLTDVTVQSRSRKIHRFERKRAVKLRRDIFLRNLPIFLAIFLK